MRTEQVDTLQMVCIKPGPGDIAPAHFASAKRLPPACQDLPMLRCVRFQTAVRSPQASANDHVRAGLQACEAALDDKPAVPRSVETRANSGEPE